jgi:hypothetical protein
MGTGKNGSGSPRLPRTGESHSLVRESWAGCDDEALGKGQEKPRASKKLGGKGVGKRGKSSPISEARTHGRPSVFPGSR